MAKGNKVAGSGKTKTDVDNVVYDMGRGMSVI
jgi:hypothetical protein